MANRKTVHLITHSTKRRRKITTMENRNSAKAVVRCLYYCLLKFSLNFYCNILRSNSSTSQSELRPLNMWLAFFPGTFIIELCHVERAYRLRQEMRCWENRDIMCERVRSCLLTWKCSVQNIKYSLRRFSHCTLAKVAHLSRHHDEGLQKCKLDVWWNNFAPLWADFAVLWPSTLRILRPAGCHISQFGPFDIFRSKYPLMFCPSQRGGIINLLYVTRQCCPWGGGFNHIRNRLWPRFKAPAPPTWEMKSQRFIS